MISDNKYRHGNNIRGIRWEKILVSIQINWCNKYYGVKKVYLFGSYAKHCETEQSDIDLLIEKGSSMSLLKLSGMRQAV